MENKIQFANVIIPLWATTEANAQNVDKQQQQQQQHV
jgi:hypothetical protein